MALLQKLQCLMTHPTAVAVKEWGHYDIYNNVYKLCKIIAAVGRGDVLAREKVQQKTSEWNKFRRSLLNLNILTYM